MSEVGLIQIRQFGGPEVLIWERSGLPHLGPDDVLMRHDAIGLNFIDVYHRTGLYPVPLPSGIGLEASGIIEQVGSNVTQFSRGQRVACATGPLGTYAERRVCPASCLVRIPDFISSEVAAACLLKGMTAEYLLERTFRLTSKHTTLIHAAGGGVGLIAVAWAKSIGAKVIGTVGSDVKARLATEAGCDVVIDYTKEDFVDAALKQTDGKGVDVVYDSVGQTTLSGSLKCLKLRGMLVHFGQSSGAVKQIDIQAIAQKSLFFSRPSLFQYVQTQEELALSSARVFAMIQSGALHIAVNHRYFLKDAARAHADLEARKLSGSTILIP